MNLGNSTAFHGAADAGAAFTAGVAGGLAVGFLDPIPMALFGGALWSAGRRSPGNNVFISIQRVALAVVLLSVLRPTTDTWVIGGLVAVAVHAAIRSLIGRRRLRAWGSGRGVSTLIIGEHDDVRETVRVLATYGEHGMIPVATVSADGTDPTVLPDGKIEDLMGMIERHDVEHVLIASPSLGPRTEAILGRRRPVGIAVSVLPPMARILTSDVDVTDLRGLPLVTLAPRRSASGPEWVLKRTFDRLMAIVGLLALSPVFALVALAIKLDSRGPVFFRQSRVGRDGELFKMWKFRSMVADAELRREEIEHLNEANGPFFKMESDPRVTRVGRILRQLSIDELPQLINVLGGAMSLVGPRPCLPNEVAEAPDLLEWRLSFLPGITGPWQVAGRSWLPVEEGLRADQHYLEHWSFGLDLKLLARTAIVAFTGDRRPAVLADSSMAQAVSPARYRPKVRGELLEAAERTTLSIVVVTHESAADIDGCMQALARLPDATEREVIVVDNASEDGSADLVRSRYPWVRVISKNSRDGSAVNSNIGASVAGGEYVMLLNPDTRVRAGAIDELIDHLQRHPGVGAVAPRLVYPDGSAQHSARRFPRPAATLIRRTPLRLLVPNSSAERTHLMVESQPKNPTHVDWVLGAAIMMRTDEFLALGGLDEGFRLYCEDIDLCWRIQERGRSVAYLPSAVVEHSLGELTRKRFVTVRTWWHFRSMTRFVRLHGFGRPTIDLRPAPELLRLPTRDRLGLVRGVERASA